MALVHPVEVRFRSHKPLQFWHRKELIKKGHSIVKLSKAYERRQVLPVQKQPGASRHSPSKE